MEEFDCFYNLVSKWLFDWLLERQHVECIKWCLSHALCGGKPLILNDECIYVCVSTDALMAFAQKFERIKDQRQRLDCLKFNCFCQLINFVFEIGLPNTFVYAF